MAHEESKPKSFETEVIERLTKIEAMLEHDYDTLHGSQNSPGLIATVSNHETRILTLETSQTQTARTGTPSPSSSPSSYSQHSPLFPHFSNEHRTKTEYFH